MKLYEFAVVNCCVQLKYLFSVVSCRVYLLFHPDKFNRYNAEVLPAKLERVMYSRKALTVF